MRRSQRGIRRQVLGFNVRLPSIACIELLDAHQVSSFGCLPTRYARRILPQE
jgi:hypothetical protein